MRDWGLHSVKFIFFYQIRKETASQFDQKWHARFLVSLLAKLIRFYLAHRHFARILYSSEQKDLDIIFIPEFLSLENIYVHFWDAKKIMNVNRGTK